VLLSSAALASVVCSSLALWVSVASGLVLLLSIEAGTRSSWLACLCLGALFGDLVCPHDLDLM
jgi:hypothetical protein